MYMRLGIHFHTVQNSQWQTTSKHETLQKAACKKQTQKKWVHLFIESTFFQFNISNRTWISKGKKSESKETALNNHIITIVYLQYNYEHLFGTNVSRSCSPRELFSVCLLYWNLFSKNQPKRIPFGNANTWKCWLQCNKTAIIVVCTWRRLSRPKTRCGFNLICYSARQHTENVIFLELRINEKSAIWTVDMVQI